VQIEQQAHEVLALHHPFGRNFRALVFILKVNTELERVADHASSIAKQVPKIRDAMKGEIPQWPTALRELGERVPTMCHQLLKAVLDEHVDAARQMVQSDAIIDQLEKRLFDETQEMIRLGGRSDQAITVGMLIYRIGRELERVGDLMASVAEDVVYVATGEIIRHEKRRKKAVKQ
jgi:phosphate transport system protein